MTAAKDEWWPEIETKEALLQTVTLETIVVAADFLMEDAFTCFAYGHGGEDFMIMESVSVISMRNLWRSAIKIWYFDQKGNNDKYLFK